MSKNDFASIIWAINNYRYCWHKNDEAIVSPMFCIYMPEETKWKLVLFPRGMAPENNFLSFFLYRDKDCNGVESLLVQYSLDILNTDGSSRVDVPKIDEFQKDMIKGFPRYEKIEKLESEHIQQDILTIRCRIFRLDNETVEMQQIFARTIIGVEKRFFQWPIKNFSNMTPDQTQSFVIKSESKEAIMQINLALASDKEGNICFGIESFDRSIKYSAVKTFVIGSLKQKVPSGEFENLFNCSKCTMFPLTLTKSDLVENESFYLPNDVLTLSFQLIVSEGITFEGIEKLVYECTPHPFSNELTKNWQKCISHKKMDSCPCALISELTALYKNQNLCDMKLKTRTNNFPVHTSILGARSPVFRAMFSSDMKEKINGFVDVSDLQDETVRRFLLYLYSDQLEDLKWDDALQLYKAADKYAVNSLKDKCSVLLKSRLNVENACEALVFSDLHQDKNLKEIVQTFILKNGKVIFKSEEWKLLASANSQLALETMLRNWNEE